MLAKFEQRRVISTIQFWGRLQGKKNKHLLKIILNTFILKMKNSKLTFFVVTMAFQNIRTMIN